MKLSFLGAARGVTESCLLVGTLNVRFLVDCGMVQGWAYGGGAQSQAIRVRSGTRREWGVAREGTGTMGCSRCLMCNTGLASCPRNSPIASSNGSPSRADWLIARR